MKIRVLDLNEKSLQENNYRDCFGLVVDGVHLLEVSDNMEPEDASLGRDLSFVYNIPILMRMAYEAGKRGEGFEVVERQVSLDEI